MDAARVFNIQLASDLSNPLSGNPAAAADVPAWGFDVDLEYPCNVKFCDRAQTTTQT